MPRPLLAVGTYTADVILAGIERLASPGEVLYLDKPFDLRAGGHAVNVSIDAVKLGYPGKVYSVGAVGGDGFGRFLVEAVRGVGAEALVDVVDVPTARNLIIALRGEDRRFHVYRGANTRLSPSHVESVLESVGPERLYLALGFSEALDREAPSLLKRARKAGVEVILVDPAYTELQSVGALKGVLGLVEAIHLNEAELKMLTGAEGVEDGLRALARLTDAIVAVTGSWGVAARIGNKVLWQPSYRVEVIDPTGAGDAFCAGLITAINPGMDTEGLLKVLAWAQAAAAAAVSSVGATEGVDKARVESIFKSQYQRIISSSRIARL